MGRGRRGPVTQCSRNSALKLREARKPTNQSKAKQQQKQRQQLNSTCKVNRRAEDHSSGNHSSLPVRHHGQCAVATLPLHHPTFRCWKCILGGSSQIPARVELSPRQHCGAAGRCAGGLPHWPGGSTGPVRHTRTAAVTSAGWGH